jgi:PTH1 family peptidyl-tRNA hydrolase
MKYLIVGLGNPGPEYLLTRHNIGFMVADTLADGKPFQSGRLGDSCQISQKGRTYILLKPNTYMNLSGKAVTHHLQHHKIPIENLMVITDDLALDFGTVRIRKQGSDGGHNGLKSIQELVGHTNYPRMRVGIGSQFSKGRQVDYVLSAFSAEEQKSLPDVLAHCAQAVLQFGFLGIDKVMTDFNKNCLSK